MDSPRCSWRSKTEGISCELQDGHAGPHIRTRCMRVEHPALMPGWGCCRCNTYNGIQRVWCKQCSHVPCLRIEVEDRTSE